MTIAAVEPRFERVAWDPETSGGAVWRVRALVLLSLLAGAWYFGWLLQPDRVGNPALYGLLLFAELFNLVQALGFWWTVTRDRRDADTPPPPSPPPTVDVFIPVYDEPLDIVEPTIAAAAKLPGAEVRVAVLDDGNRSSLEAMARRYGARYFRRGVNTGAKAGNINHALARTDAPFVVVLDCDHVPGGRLLTATLGYFADDDVAFVQTPQYYANAGSGGVPEAAWSQQSLFFGPIARGKDRHGAMFCCGTNVVFRRRALEEAGGFPETSITEDFELSVDLHERGWRSVYVPKVLVRGLGPEDMASYVSQQRRWARGCLSALPRVLRASLPLRLRAQYLLSGMYFLTGWTVLVYMSLPVIRILTGAQPLAGATADQFLVHFAPYYGIALLTVAAASAGTYTFAAFSLAVAGFWVQIGASISVLTGRKGRFVVTPKKGSTRRQPRAVLPALCLMVVLVAVALWGLARSQSPATLNNVSFALLHVSVLAAGVGPALRRQQRPAVDASSASARRREAA
jgi:cellulose synthase/poly-beta-1,6-N-acetylglucosamine synthase-like glycosyltransferase